MAQPRGAGTPQALRLSQELLERIDRYAARLESELPLSVSRSDALRRLLTLALEDPEDTAEDRGGIPRGLSRRCSSGPGSGTAAATWPAAP
jgi:hypothetical protein